ncbi:MAG: putative acetyltransferase [Candidatus Azotimanducaceae bacterium]|jgi:putative acetyltransferase
MTDLTVRGERPEDIGDIFDITELAFRGRPYAGGDEQDLVNRLRDTNALALSLVAEIGGCVVGQITFSLASNSDESGPWFALGPVSVIPELQNEGIGSALINRGLAEIRDRGALGCILTGNPDYYQRFGFKLCPANVPAEESAEFFQLKILCASSTSGMFEFHPAFYQED